MVLNNRSNFCKYIKGQKDGNYEMRVRKWRKKRSLDQNALYWLWISIIAEDTGFDPEELHTSFRGMFLTDRSQKIPIIRSTTTSNKLEFSQYLKKVEREANELGITLPQPERY